MRCILQVKSTTSNNIVVGESGQILPSISCHINAICYLHRLRNLPTNTLVKAMYMELSKLHECGFNTWVSKALTLVQKYGIDTDMGSGASFNRYCKSHIYNHFKITWKDEVQNIDKILFSEIIKYINQNLAWNHICISYLTFDIETLLPDKEPARTP